MTTFWRYCNERLILCFASQLAVSLEDSGSAADFLLLPLIFLFLFSNSSFSLSIALLKGKKRTIGLIQILQNLLISLEQFILSHPCDLNRIYKSVFDFLKISSFLPSFIKFRAISRLDILSQSLFFLRNKLPSLLPPKLLKF